MIRLNKSIRETILSNWIKDKRQKKILNDFSVMKKSIFTIANNQFKNQIKVAVDCADLVKEGYISTTNQTGLPWSICNVISVPYHVNKILNLREQNYRYIRASVPTMAITSRYYSVEDHIDKDKIQVVLKKFHEKLEVIESEILSISGILYSLSSVGKLLDLVPEFKKYVPKPEAKAGELISLSEIEKVKNLLKRG